MTAPHRTEALAAPSLTAAVVALRARGMRVSGTRRTLLATLFATDGPRTADELAQGLDQASVYRNLDALERVGLVRHVHVGHGPGRYVLAARSDRGAVACDRCGRDAALDGPALAAVVAAVRDATGFTPDLSHFPIVGRCPTCTPRKEHHAHP